MNAEIQAALAELQTTITDLVADVDTGIQTLLAKIAAGEDTTDVVAGIQAATAKLKELDVTAEAQVPPVVPPTDAPAAS